MRPRRRAHRVAALAATLALAACAAPYRERPPESRAGTPRTTEKAAGNRDVGPTPPADSTGRTVVGYVAPDGTLHADTLAGAQPDTARVERETVVTGALGRPADTIAPPVSAAPERHAAGYRVQVFASQDQPAADDFARQIEERLPSEPVYVEWDEPWYKVRVGDFTDRGEADRLRLRLVEMGFGEAWTVPASIRPAQ